MVEIWQQVELRTLLDGFHLRVLLKTYIPMTSGIRTHDSGVLNRTSCCMMLSLIFSMSGIFLSRAWKLYMKPHPRYCKLVNTRGV
jgi:hypothetical protein